MKVSLSVTTTCLSHNFHYFLQPWMKIRGHIVYYLHFFRIRQRTSTFSRNSWRKSFYCGTHRWQRICDSWFQWFFLFHIVTYWIKNSLNKFSVINRGKVIEHFPIHRNTWQKQISTVYKRNLSNCLKKKVKSIFNSRKKAFPDLMPLIKHNS